MAYPQAFNAYKNASVTTASSGQLVVMLYDEVVKQLTLAMSLFDENGKVIPEIKTFLDETIFNLRTGGGRTGGGDPGLSGEPVLHQGRLLQEDHTSVSAHGRRSETEGRRRYHTADGIHQRCGPSVLLR